MTIKTKHVSTMWEHPQYAATKKSVKRMRDSIAGEDVIKSNGTTYLPHPCHDSEQQKTPEQSIR